MPNRNAVRTGNSMYATIAFADEWLKRLVQPLGHDDGLQNDEYVRQGGSCHREFGHQEACEKAGRILDLGRDSVDGRAVIASCLCIARLPQGHLISLRRWPCSKPELPSPEEYHPTRSSLLVLLGGLWRRGLFLTRKIEDAYRKHPLSRTDISKQPANDRLLVFNVLPALRRVAPLENL